MNTAVIGLGSNIQPNVHIARALGLLAQKFCIIGKTEFIKTKPVGFADQPDFINGAVMVQSYLDCHQLRVVLKAIEQEMGRVKTDNKFGPRIIDLDILVFNREIVDKDCYEREFLKRAVKELMPDLIVAPDPQGFKKN